MTYIAKFRKQANLVITHADALAVRHGLESIFAQEPLNCINADLRGTAEIVIAEALNNIVEHAYAECPGSIEISVNLDKDGLDCTIADFGAPMPNHALPAGHAHDLAQMADLPEGGFGWFLIRTLAQDLRYARSRDQNYLHFRVPITAQVA